MNKKLKSFLYLGTSFISGKSENLHRNLKEELPGRLRSNHTHMKSPNLSRYHGGRTRNLRRDRATCYQQHLVPMERRGFLDKPDHPTYDDSSA